MTFRYTGTSMYPTFKTGDMITVIPYREEAAIRSGDVIVFTDPRDGGKTIHRVVRADKDHIKTKGDSFRSADAFLLKISDIIGRVRHLERRGKIHKVYGGFAGRFTGVSAICLRRFADNFIKHFISPAYRRLSERSALGFIAPFLKLRIIKIERPAASCKIKILLGDEVIARKSSAEETYIKRPFKPILNRLMRSL